MAQVIVDSHIRSLLKGLSWRFTATAATVVIALLVTGSAEVALTIGGIEAVAKILIYYLHERAWIAVPWGRKAVPAASRAEAAEAQPVPVPVEAR